MQSVCKVEQIIQTIQKTNYKLVLYVTGCAASAMGWLSLYPGSSKYLLSGHTLYSRGALTKAIRDEVLKPVSETIALKMSMKAFIEGHQIIINEKDTYKNTTYFNKDVLGVGVTGTLKTNEPNQQQHHAYICLQYLDKSYLYYIDLIKDKRSRIEEDVLISEKIFVLIALHNGAFQILNYNQQQIDAILSQGFIENEKIQLVQKRENFSPINLIIANPEIYNIVYEPNRDICINKQFENVCIMSGSFNPFHTAHQEIAELAASMFNIKKSNIIYELAITNADLGTIDLQNIHDRIKPMLEQNFTVCITNSPFFTYKNRFISDSIYAIGMDTLIRILDKKYYAFSQIETDIKLMEFRKKNNKFAVAPRYNPKTQKIENLKDVAIPSYLQEYVFQIDYQNEISSTIIRKQSSKY